MMKRSYTRRGMLAATGATVALGGGLIGYLPQAAAQSAPRQVRRIAIMTPERGTDMGWNQAGVTAARAAAQRLGVQLEIAEGLGYPDIRPIMRELAGNGADLIIAHASGYNNTAFEIGVERSVPVAVVDTPRKVTRPGLVVDYTLSGHEGAYIAGTLAARKTRTGTIGIVVSGEPPSWNSQSHAFASGARSVRANIPIRYAVIGPAAFSDAPGGRRVAEAVIAAGADIILGQGNGATMGMLQAITTARATDGGQAWLIDVIGDKSQAAPNHLLTSVLWDITETIVKMVEDIRAGRFGARPYTIGLADNSVRLLRTPHLTDADWAEVEAVKARITGGQAVPYVGDAAAVRALMSDVQAPAAR